MTESWRAPSPANAYPPLNPTAPLNYSAPLPPPPPVFVPPPYGYAPPGPYGYGYGPPPPTGPRNGFGVTALVCGLIGALLGILPFLFPFAGVLGVIALVFGLLGIGRVRRGEATNLAMSVVGTLLAVASLVLAVIGVVTIVNAVEDGVGKVGSYLECVSDVSENDPQRDAKIRQCNDRF